MSGGYPDDEDRGNEIIYTGHGGRSESGRQVRDQLLAKGNLGLARSKLDQREIRVVRGHLGDPNHSPRTGYRYEGLFQVVDYWHSRSADGPLIWRFRLCKIVGAPVPAPNDEHEARSPPLARTTRRTASSATQHVLFDEGAIIVDGTWTVRNALTGELLGPLRTTPGRSITAAHLQYHREHRGS